MRVGISTEIKEDENHVAITPSGVAAFKQHGHDVVIHVARVPAVRFETRRTMRPGPRL